MDSKQIVVGCLVKLKPPQTGYPPYVPTVEAGIGLVLAVHDASAVFHPELDYILVRVYWVGVDRMSWEFVDDLDMYRPI